MKLPGSQQISFLHPVLFHFPQACFQSMTSQRGYPFWSTFFKKKIIIIIVQKNCEWTMISTIIAMVLDFEAKAHYMHVWISYTKSLFRTCEPLAMALNSTPSRSESSGIHHSIIFPEIWIHYISQQAGSKQVIFFNIKTITSKIATKWKLITYQFQNWNI